MERLSPYHLETRVDRRAPLQRSGARYREYIAELASHIRLCAAFEHKMDGIALFAANKRWCASP